MSTKTKEKKGNAPESLPIVQVPIHSIRVMEQHRRFFDEKKIKELAGSIAKINILHPLLLRQDPEDPALFILVAGERRLRAAKIAGLEEVPARVGPWNEQEAAEVQAFENLHRADLTPIEEARAFKTLKDVSGHDVDALAERVDKSVAYVYRALALLELPAKILKEIEAGELTPAHGHQLLRCPPEDREKVYHEWKEDWSSKDKSFTASSLREFVESRQDQELDKAIFPKNVPYAGETACAGCPFNSGNQGQLFDGAQKGKCLKASCFIAKTEAARTEVGEKALKSFPGVQLAGVVERHHTGFPNVKGIIIRKKTLATKKLQELVKAEPKKFSLVIAKEQTYGDNTKPEAFLVCKSKEVLEAAGIATQTTKEETGSSGHSSEPRKSPKDKFIEEHIGKVILAATARVGSTLSDKKAWALVVQEIYWQADNPRAAFAACGLEDRVEARWKFMKSLEAIDVKKLKSVAVAMMVGSVGDPESALKALGLDMASIKKQATTEAKTAWERRGPDAKE